HDRSRVAVMKAGTDHMRTTAIPAIITLLALSSAGCAASRTGPSDSDTFTIDPPGLIPVVFAPGHVSIPGHNEMGCTFLTDLSEFWFVRSEGPQSGDPWTLMVCHINGEEWSLPAAAPFDPDCLEIAPHTSPDGSRFLIYRQKLSDPGFQEGTWIATRGDEGWEEPTFFHEGYSMTSALDGWFYFCTEHREGTSRDLARFRIETGAPTLPEDLTGAINSEHWEAHPWISPDGTLVLFDLSLPEGIEGGGIQVSFRSDDGSWGAPINLGQDINGSHALIPSLSPDGRWLFYSNGEDLMWIDAEVVYSLRPGG
ncbi:hypothetical protein ACFL6R_06525, partial [Gemmatimonadota bacterium]